MSKTLIDQIVEIVRDGILAGFRRDAERERQQGLGVVAFSPEQWADERAKNIANQLQLVLADSPTEIDQLGQAMQALDLSVTIQSPEVKRHPVDGGRPIPRSFIAHASIGMPPRRSMVKAGARLSLVLGQVIEAAKEDLT